MPHPAEQFRAPSSIQSGTPLKELLDRRLIGLIADSFAAVVPNFNRRGFVREANSGLDDLELMPRAQHIANAMAEHLAAVPAEASRQLIASLGPELTVTKGYGLKVFFYLPHTAFIARHLIADWSAGMQANYEITKRFSGEFSIRPFLMAEQERTLARLAIWAKDANHHVRRLVSEGTRSRLPWAGRLPAFIRDPMPVLPLLHQLIDDSELYVRRSVANHVGDIAKDNPQIAFDLCHQWLRQPTRERCQVVRHAVRHPAKQGVKAAVSLRRSAGGRG